MPAINASKLYLVLTASMLAGAVAFGAHAVSAADPQPPPCQYPNTACLDGVQQSTAKCVKTVVVTGMHYPTQSCKQSWGAFDAGKMKSYHLTSKCQKPTKLSAVFEVKCQDAPIPGFPTGSVYTATACCA